MKTVAFTGKRPQSLPWRFDELDGRCLQLKERLKTEIENCIKGGYTAFISGMALGVDTYAAEAVLELKKAYPSITLEAAIPCESQSDRWSAADRERYRSLLSKCDTVTYVGREYTDDCMMKRNYYMCDKADLLIAVAEDFSGGTGKTCLYAQRKDKEIRILNP